METDLNKIFARLKKLLKKYENPLKSKYNEGTRYDLWSFKDVDIAGRKRSEVFFSEVSVRSKYVGFYYMPIYTDTTLQDCFAPELLKLLKGKSCFHIRKLDAQLEQQIADALKIGFELYQKRGWV